MTDQWWTDDEQLLANLGDAVRAGSDVPAHFIELGKGVFAWRSVDHELAQLVYDSSLEGHAGTLVGARGEQGSVRAVTFATGQLTIEVEVGPDAVRGQLVPPQPADIEVRGPGGPVVTVPVDGVGWFVITPVPAGPFELLVRTELTAPVRTGWIGL